MNVPVSGGTSYPSAFRTDLLFYLACFIFLYLHLFVFPFNPIYYEADHSALLNDAKRMVEGEFIYRDFFEFAFPGAPLLYALFISVFGAKLWILNAAILVHGMIAAYLGVLVSRKLSLDTPLSYIPSALFIFFGFRWFGIDGEHRMFSPLFIYLAVFVLLGGRTYGRVAIAGVLCSVASFFTQQRGFLGIVGIVILLIIEFGLVEKKWAESIKLIFILGVSSGLSLLLMLAPFVFLAGSDVFFRDTILFLQTYAQDPEFNGLQTYFATFSKLRNAGLTITLVTLFYSLLIPAVYVAAIVFVIARWRRNSYSTVSGILIVCVIGLLQSIASSGPNVYRFYQVSLTALIALCWLTFQANFLKPFVSRVVLTALILFGLGLSVRLQTSWELKFLDTASGRIVFPSPLASERYEWLVQNTLAGEAVYETYNAHVNYPLGLHNPCRISVLLNSPYSPPEHVKWVVEDLERTKPRFIIWDGTWTVEMEAPDADQRLRPIYVFLTENYRRVKSFIPYDNRNREIWKLNETGTETGIER